MTDNGKMEVQKNNYHIIIPILSGILYTVLFYTPFSIAYKDVLLFIIFMPLSWLVYRLILHKKQIKSSYKNRLIFFLLFSTFIILSYAFPIILKNFDNSLNIYISIFCLLFLISLLVSEIIDFCISCICAIYNFAKRNK